MKKFLSTLIAVLLIFLAETPAFATNDSSWEILYKKINENTSHVYIEDNQIFVIGYGMSPKFGSKGSFYKSFARQAARFDAFNQLAECIYGVNIESETTVKEDLVVSDKWVSKVDSTQLKGVKQVGEAKFLEDGSCEVIMKMPYPKN